MEAGVLTFSAPGVFLVSLPEIIDKVPSFIETSNAPSCVAKSKSNLSSAMLEFGPRDNWESSSNSTPIEPLCKSLALRGELAQLDPRVLMCQANLEISRDNPEMFFVTAFIGVLDLRTGELSYCNAGHDRPLLFAPGSPPRELEGVNGPPICIVEGFEYRTHRQQLAAGEFLCLFTDGVTEAFSPTQQLYGKDRLHSELTQAVGNATARDVLDSVCSSVHAFAAGAEPSDDLTVLVLRWTP